MGVTEGYQEFVTDKWALAADLGQSNDPTAICVMQHRVIERGHWREGLTKVSEHFDVRHLQRLPLGLSYVDQVAEVRRLLARPPLKDGCKFTIDSTGVGRAVGDLFNDAGMNPTQVTITAGNEQTRVDHYRWHVPKSILISTLDARLHLGELRFAAALSEAGAMAEELKDFRRKVTAAGRSTWEARVGSHDDLVLSCALALWSFVGLPNPAIVTVPTDWY
ncbi:hypothetical protein NB311A_06036 [Nitrobacter sp. Nb-311A]|uniref:hypothetical protein n=1 Tax=Nitrobacter sp. Nb-311A TaxID=314253 RepID=UPI00006852B3|nr:hypothetical protein [Nitrobacter sp. Nb-311A]EAQ34554.1 hypothetical protein NB311A_06036 [Nitrobacter sp. Nb-311A]